MLIVDCIIGMSKKHREVLRKKRSELLRCIHIDEGFLSELLSDSVITHTMKEEIDVSNIQCNHLSGKPEMLENLTVVRENVFKENCLLLTSHLQQH